MFSAITFSNTLNMLLTLELIVKNNSNYLSLFDNQES